MGEIVQQVQAVSERSRREHQASAILAARQAVYTGYVFNGRKGEKLPEVYEAFPFWTEEEIRQIKIEKVRTTMNRLANRKRKGGEP